MTIDCPFCYPEFKNSLTFLTKEDCEYNLAIKTMDGTKKWFKCHNCKGVFCRDKLKGIWQLSPLTYGLFIEKGWIKDLIND